MLLGTGFGQAWSVFVKYLQAEHHLSSAQTQLIFTTFTMTFSLWIIVAGRLHDRFGPRRVAFAGSAIYGAGFLVAWLFGHHYLFLWIGMGLLVGMGVATVYTCPIATAIKWFPQHRGLMAGLAAAAFGLGPILVQRITVPLLTDNLPVLQVLGRLGLLYVPVLLLLSLLMFTPPGTPAHQNRVKDFQARTLRGDLRFWMLAVGMLCGTFPFLVFIGNVRTIASAWQVGAATVAWAIPTLAIGNAAGRVFWGAMLDRVGTRPSMWGAQVLAVVATCIAPWTAGHPAVFLACLAGVGFCYGSNFAIYPGTIARVYGVELLGSVYPWVMAAQGIASFGPYGAGMLNDSTHSFLPGMALAAGVAVIGLGAGLILGRRQGQM